MRSEGHPGAQVIRRFMAGDATPGERRLVVRHLLAGCPPCRKVASDLWPWGWGERRPARRSSRFDSVFSRAVGAILQRRPILERERHTAATLEGELASHPPERQLVLVLNSRRYHNWFLCERLLERVFDAGFEDPAKAEKLAEVGVALSTALDEAVFGAAVVNDLRARAWSLLGNARRIRGDFSAAREALETSWKHLELGTGDLLEEAAVCRRQAVLEHDCRHYELARSHFDRAIALYRSTGDDHLVGRTLIDKAKIAGEAGDVAQEIRLLEKGLRLLDEERDPRMALAARHNLTVALHESGRLDEALALLHEILPQRLRLAEPMNLLRLRWMEGRLAHAQGELERAEAAFLEVQREFVQREIGFDAALSSLDLATVYLEQGRTADLKSLAAEMVSTFQSLGVHPEALAAYTLFHKSVEIEGLTLGFIRDLTAYLEKARNNPDLPFHPQET